MTGIRRLPPLEPLFVFLLVQMLCFLSVFNTLISIVLKWLKSFKEEGLMLMLLFVVFKHIWRLGCILILGCVFSTSYQQTCGLCTCAHYVHYGFNLQVHTVTGSVFQHPISRRVVCAPVHIMFTMVSTLRHILVLALYMSPTSRQQRWRIGNDVARALI